MPAPIHPERVPALPVHTVVITVHGTTIDGEQVEALPAHDDRMATLAELRRRAALRGRPVRVTAKEPDGRVDYFIVSPEGDVLSVPYGHPRPEPAPAPPPPHQPEPASPTAAHAPPPVPHRPEPVDAWHQQATAQATRYEQRARAEHGPASDEAARWARIRHQLSTEAEPWAASTELWIASLAEGINHLPADSRELFTVAQTAFDCWRKITDPAEAASTGPRLLAVVKQLDHPELAAYVEQWTAQAAAAAAPRQPAHPDTFVNGPADQ